MKEKLEKVKKAGGEDAPVGRSPGDGRVRMVVGGSEGKFAEFGPEVLVKKQWSFWIGLWSGSCGIDAFCQRKCL